jgi:hypothetical protein
MRLRVEGPARSWQAATAFPVALGKQRSQARIDGFALERQHAKDTLVNTPERLALTEAFQPFDPQRELP